MNMFWAIILSNAVVAGLMAITAALIGRLWKNPAAVHVLWLAVLVKLFTPPLATLSWPVQPATPPAARIADQQPLEQGSPHPTAVGDGDESTVAGPPVPKVTIQPADLNRHPAAATSFVRKWRPTTVLSALWLAGSACLALAYSLRIRRFVRLMSGFEPASDETQLLVSKLSTRLGLRRVPEALTTEHTLPPLVWSMGGRPCLVLPSRLFDGLAEEARASILLHELAHVRRRDYLVRLLELAATVGFWWHPVVWWSRRRLRDLEEECCDAIVLEASPSQAKTYALALLETLDFLSRTPRLGVPLPTAVHSTDSLTRRIRMLAQPRPAKLRPLPAALVFGLVTLPLAVAFSAEPPQAPSPQTSPQAQNAPPAAKPAVIVGEVKNQSGEPLADARVLAVYPFVELRTRPPAPSSKRYEVRTDADGKYRLVVPDLDVATTIAVDVLKPGYRRSTGMPMGPRIDDRRLKVGPGEEVNASFTLEPSLYFKGVAVDEAGKPVGNATVHAQLHWDRSGGWVERTITGNDGSFELFNYPEDASIFDEKRRPAAAEVLFTHPDHVDVRTSNLYNLSENERKSLRVVMARGSRLSGTILDSSGAPVPGVVVGAEANGGGPGAASGSTRKSTTTDATGKFVLRGVARKRNTIRVLSTAIGQKTMVRKDVDGDEEGIAIDLKPMELPSTFKSHEVLGMKLTEMTPELRKAYEIYTDKGVVVMDPGADSYRFGIGRLAKGYTFWMVGRTQVGTVQEFVKQLIAEAERGGNTPAHVRVVYCFVGAEQEGTNTQYLNLTPADVDQLKAALKVIE
ncbi:M56 family metallopeptidase [Paludisphaera rhizosphaerae]|uniref:M56 family metallopeptidase n=1 Tax=Paludisphaera rhizosphaerae TaxID=2711216 RepID=UPI0013EC6185|nr:M56 family metallopeptidase [Paludisphaera rhizosphaerae]